MFPSLILPPPRNLRKIFSPIKFCPFFLAEFYLRKNKIKYA
jgi:hypothetical protein